ncbi:hypothetical protein FB451DRAFT_624192 [Mycena latifolia]|nr:hypothetical protein FB451DRAFT_624192 [Mycena latifolia]
MPADELHRRARELSAANGQQQEPTLEQTRSHGGRELLDPIAREMPVEIAAEILTLCLPTTPIPDSLQAPMLFMNISRSWTNIALSTPELWTSIQIQFPRPDGFENLFDAWLTRARSRKTSISLRGPVPQAVAGLVHQHAPRVRNLELYISTGKRLAPLTGAFSSLKTLTIEQDAHDTSRPSEFAHSPSGCIELLRAAPDLVECNFNGVYFKDVSDDVHASQLLTFASLRHLRLGKGDSEGNSAAMLAYLTLPTLQSLSMSDFDIPFYVASSFTRSSPPLHSLCMYTSIEDWENDLVANFFRLVPSLIDLKLRAEESLDFLAVLATTHDFLPNLRNLTVLTRWLPSDRAGYDNLISMLSARRTQFQSFRLCGFIGIDAEEENPLDADIIVALRQFVADGMHIHIGTETTNLI